MTASTRVNIFRMVFILYLGVVAYLCFATMSHLPNVSRTIFGIPTDKVVHFLMFFPFPVLLYFSLGDVTKKPWHTFVLTLFVFLTGVLVGAGTEVIQGFTPARTSDVLDFRADAISMAISSMIVFFIDISKAFKRSDNQQEKDA